MQTNFYSMAHKIDELSYKYSLNNLDQIESYFGNKGIKEYFIRKVAGQIDENFDPNPWFESLYKKGYFNPKNNPKPYKSSKNIMTTPYWTNLLILENVAKKNENKLNDNMHLLGKILDDIIGFKGGESNAIRNYLTDYRIIKIMSHLHLEMIKSDYIDFIRISLDPIDDSQYSSDNLLISGEIKDHIFPKFINSENLTLNLLDVIFSYKKVGYRYNSIMENHYFNDSLKQFKEKIKNSCGIQAADVALKKIKAITKIEPWQFNIATIEDHPQSTFIDDFDYQLVYFIRYIFESMPPSQIRDKIATLIGEENSIFKRIAIHSIHYHYSELKDLFWNLNYNPLNISELRHEIYVLLEDKFKDFNSNEYNKLIDWIKNCTYYIPEQFEDNKKEKERVEAYEKLRWLEAMKKSDNLQIQQLYAHYKNVYPEKLDHPDFDSWHGEIRTLKPVKPIKLCKKPNSKIANSLKIISEKQEVSSFDENGSYKSFKKCVYDNPEKFSINLAPFLSVPRKDQSELLLGLYNAWRAGKSFEWYNILAFIWTIISSESFWNEYPSEGFSYNRELLYTISDLIEERTRRDDNPLDKNLLPITCEILIILSEKINSKFTGDDLVTDVLNSSKGRIYGAMINFSLSYARQYKKEEDVKWLSPIKSDLIEKLEKHPSIELAVVLGQYLPQIFYLDKEWATQNIELIFSPNNWEYAFNGYLYTSKIYENVYNLLKQKNFYDKALNTDFSGIEANNNLVHQICIAYLFDKEKIEENSLICKLINNKNVNQIKELFRFFLMQENENYEIAKEKSRRLFQIIFAILFEDPEYYKDAIAIVPRLLFSFDLVNKIKSDSMFRYLLKSLKYISPHNLFIMKHLSSFVHDSPKMTAKIYNEMISNRQAPEYGYENEIKEIVAVLYENNLENDANKICNYYGENGSYFLRELYFQNNNLKVNS